MNKLAALLAAAWAQLPRYAPVLTGVITGLASIAAGRENEGVQQILQAAALLSAGTAIVIAHRSTTAQIHQVHLTLNGRLDQLLQLATALARAEGTAAGVAGERASQAALKQPPPV